MKVIHLISGGDTGGAKTHVLGLLQNLNRTITAQLVCFRDGPFADEARSMGIPVKIVAGNNLVRILRQLKEYILEGGYQIIHCHGSRGNMIGSLLRKSTGLPVVTTVHSDYRLDYLGRPISQITFGNINAIALRKLDYRIGVSDAMVDQLIQRGFPPDRFFSIYNGIDFTPPSDLGDPLAYLRSLGANVDETSVVVGIAARMNPVKDMSTLIRGFAAGHARCSRLRLVIAGDGEEREKLRALAEELHVTQEVCFAGWISEGMDRFYNALDINALTSLSETFPYALTEGARFHLATVASDVGGIPYLIRHGVNGYLFTPGDWTTLGGYLADLAEDDALRHRLGENLFQKASTDYSIEKTVETQLHIYDEILRRESRPKKKRDGVVICGAYGRGNAGDDAILEAILQEMRTIDPYMPITVLSRNPESTRLAYRVQAIERMNLISWYRAMRKSWLYINGGGSLIQDVTSSRSLYFYLMNICAAKILKNKVQMYGCGIGPVQEEGNRRMVSRMLNRYVDVITLREPDSRQELERMHVTKPRILLTADPALVLQRAPDDITDSVMIRAGIPPHGRYICFALRRWEGYEGKAELFGKAAQFAWDKWGLTPVFISVEKHQDPGANRLAARTLACPHYFLDDAGQASSIIGVLSRMQIIVSMRLHALIFAAGQGVPLVGVVYDPKVSAFLKYIGQELYVDLEAMTEETLEGLVEQAYHLTRHPEIQEAAVRRLREMERQNVEIARQLLEES